MDKLKFSRSRVNNNIKTKKGLAVYVTFVTSNRVPDFNYCLKQVAYRNIRK